MKMLYICAAGNLEAVRLALNINKVKNRWDKIVILDDDSSKHGKSILGVEIVGPFSMLGEADPANDEATNMVARTTKGRQSTGRKIQSYGLSLATLIDPGVDMLGVEYGKDITVYLNAICCAGSFIDEGSVVLMRALVGHGARLGKGCVVAPGAVINARVELGEGVYVGSNASILPDLKVGAWATIGANSSVIQDVPAGATVMGVPAQVIIPGDENYSLQSESSSVKEAPTGTMSRAGSTLQTGESSKARSGPLEKLRLAQEKFISACKMDKK